MPHGDFSDFAAWFSLIVGGCAMYNPLLAGKSIGPVGPFFDKVSTDMVPMIGFAGAALMYVGFTLFVVRWNTVNGIAGSIGCATIAIKAGLIAYQMDGGAFVLRGWHLFIAFYTLAALHLKFNANPVYTSAMLAEKEAEKAKKGN